MKKLIVVLMLVGLIAAATMASAFAAGSPKFTVVCVVDGAVVSSDNISLPQDKTAFLLFIETCRAHGGHFRVEK